MPSAWRSPRCADRIQRVDPDPATHFHNWLTKGAIAGENDGTPYLSYFAYEKTFWDSHTENNLLFVHYGDLQADLTGEMRRIADFLEIEISDADLSRMAGSASFESMRKDAAVLIPEMAKNFEGGALRLLNKGNPDAGAASMTMRTSSCSTRSCATPFLIAMPIGFSQGG